MGLDRSARLPLGATNRRGSQAVTQKCFFSISPAEKAYAGLLEAAQHETTDLVNCFRNTENISPVVNDAIATRAKAVWMQLGVVNEAAAAKAAAAGLVVVQDQCIKVLHRAHRRAAG